MRWDRWTDPLALDVRLLYKNKKQEDGSLPITSPMSKSVSSGKISIA